MTLGGEKRGLERSVGIFPFSGGQNGKWSSLSTLVFQCLGENKHACGRAGGHFVLCLRGTHEPDQVRWLVSNFCMQITLFFTSLINAYAVTLVSYCYLQ